jgi:Flp pilus assembly protein TadG
MIRRFSIRSHPSPRRSRGQALVEFAFVAPIFFLLLFAILDFGRYVYYVQILNNAAREGARYAIVHGSGSFTPTGPGSDDPTIAAIVKNYATGVVGTGATFAIHSIWGDGGAGATNDRGQKVKVTITYQFQSMIPVVPIPAITINGESTLVINH